MSHLLDTVDSGDLMAEDVTPRRQRELKAEAMEAHNYSWEDAKPFYERKLRQEREKAALGFDEEGLEEQADSEAHEWAQNQAKAGRAISRGAIARQRDQILSELTDEAREKGRVRR